MLLFGYDVYINTTSPDNKLKSIEVKELDTLLPINSHTLYFNNNQYRKVSITSDKPFNSLSKNQTINFIVENVVIFSFKKGDSTIFFKLYEEGTEYLVKYWLTHTFLPIFFTLEDKYYFLHAGGVEIDSKVILFVANSFGGKSTLTDYFIKKNHTMLSDDKVAVYEEDKNIIAVPSYPYHRPYRKVEDLGYFVENFAKKNSEIKYIFNLVKSDSQSDIIISEIFGLDKFKVLRYSSEIDLPINKNLRFEMISKIANKTKVYNITIPWDLDRLEEVYQSIISFIKKD